MKISAKTPEAAPRRLPKAERRRQLLEAGMTIVREQGADRLTLGHLAERAGVSKPVVYDHFETRSALLIALYRWIDLERVATFRSAMDAGAFGTEETYAMLASAYIQCAADTKGEFHAVGAALAGSDEKAAVFQELLDNCVQMFVAVLKPHTELSRRELERRCVGLVGAGESLSAALVKGQLSEGEAARSLKAIIRGAVG